MRQFTAYIRARAAFMLFLLDGTLCILGVLCITPYLMYYNSYPNSFNRGLAAVSGVTCRGGKLIYASGSVGNELRSGMRSGVTSLPALTLVLHIALPCVTIVDLFRNA